MKQDLNPKLNRMLDGMEESFAAFLIEARKNANGNKAAGVRARKAWRVFRDFTGNSWAHVSISESRTK